MVLSVTVDVMAVATVNRIVDMMAMAKAKATIEVDTVGSIAERKSQHYIIRAVVSQPGDDAVVKVGPADFSSG